MRADMNETEELLTFFLYEHLPEHLQDVSRKFCKLANQLVDQTPRNRERTAGLRKLLEAKDCFVRASLYYEDFDV